MLEWRDVQGEFEGEQVSVDKMIRDNEFLARTLMVQTLNPKP